MARALSFLIRYFSNYYTLHRSDLAARAAPPDPRLQIKPNENPGTMNINMRKIFFVYSQTNLYHLS